MIPWLILSAVVIYFQPPAGLIILAVVVANGISTAISDRRQP
jgi:hypothetical protein